MSTVEAVRRSNNFDALRLLAAFGVILGHAAVLLGRPADAPLLFGVAVHQLGVSVFFVISGYLIAGSWQRTRSLRIYFTSRILRIFPGLILVVLVTLFVLGPILTTLPLADYFGSTRTWTYLRNITLLPSYDLPGVFDRNPYPVAVNGSLWTLAAEFACYLVVPVIGSLPTRLQVAGWAAFGIVSAVFATAFQVEIFGARVESAAYMWVFFAAGAIARLGVDRARFRLDVAAAVALVWLVVSALLPAYAVWIAWIGLPYCLLAIGMASTPVIRRASRFGDLSYGLYLWAFPVQQTVVLVAGAVPYVLDVFIVTVISAMLAYISWHAVERPAMSLGSRATAWNRRPGVVRL